MVGCLIGWLVACLLACLVGIFVSKTLCLSVILVAARTSTSKILSKCPHGVESSSSCVFLQSPLKAQDDEKIPPKQELDPERTPSGRVKRVSAQVAIFHLQEIASEELLKEWPKRKVQQDLVPDDKKV